MKSVCRHCFLVCLLLSTVIGCSPAEIPVGEVRVDPELIDLSYPGYVPIQIHWNMLSDLGPDVTDPLVFVHLLDSGGGIARTFDHPLSGEWQAGREEQYSMALYQSALAPPLSDGTYRLTVGVYDNTGMRWPLKSAGGAVAGTEYQVGEVVVDSKESDVPMFFFSPSWLTLEAGTDAQVLGRRWLSGEGTIRIAKLSSAGTLWLRIRIPKVEGTGAEIVLNEGETEALVAVSSSCGAVGTVVAGVGAHEIHVELGPDESGAMPEECELVLSPNYRVVDDESLAQRSAALELLTWLPKA
jgi:hypothetical protein